MEERFAPSVWGFGKASGEGPGLTVPPRRGDAVESALFRKLAVGDVGGASSPILEQVLGHSLASLWRFGTASELLANMAWEANCWNAALSAYITN